MTNLEISPLKYLGLLSLNDRIDDFYRFEERISRDDDTLVYLSTHMRSHEHYAIKVIDFERYPHQKPEKYLTEVKVLQYLRHPNIIRCYHTYFSSNILHMVFEYCELGSLQDVYCKLGHGLSEDQIISVCHQVLKGLRYLHGHGLIHRDIRCRNILLKSNGKVKLNNFGRTGAYVVNGKKQLRTSLIGSPYWMAPEVLEKNSGVGYDEKADIWSLGITVIECVQCDPPLASISPYSVVEIIPNMPPPNINDEYTSISENLRIFVADLLRINPKERYSVRTLLEHQIFDRYDHNSLKSLSVQTTDIWDGWSWDGSEDDTSSSATNNSADTIEPMRVHLRKRNSRNLSKRKTRSISRELISSLELSTIIQRDRSSSLVDFKKRFSPRGNEESKYKKKSAAHQNMKLFSFQDKKKIQKKQDKEQSELYEELRYNIKSLSKNSKYTKTEMEKYYARERTNLEADINAKMTDIDACFEKEKNSLLSIYKENNISHLELAMRYERELLKIQLKYDDVKRKYLIASEKSLAQLQKEQIDHASNIDINHAIKVQKLEQRFLENFRNLLYDQICGHSKLNQQKNIEKFFNDKKSKLLKKKEKKKIDVNELIEKTNKLEESCAQELSQLDKFIERHWEKTNKEFLEEVEKTASKHFIELCTLTNLYAKSKLRVRYLTDLNIIEINYLYDRQKLDKLKLHHHADTDKWRQTTEEMETLSRRYKVDKAKLEILDTETMERLDKERDLLMDKLSDV
eukprot:TRINITY_DN1218_c0_g1_i3.p1 TRINITY_DN1218_c0_g1~~TRINITY_DN1218_c0_g1_i3.p1  ORF type:complete len:743 (+),score=141.50 TRINITY_DN1218_c0_g1_i3:419-2647(+)